MNGLNLSGAGNRETFGRAWIVYAIHDGKTAAVIFVGCCRLAEVFKMPDWKGDNRRAVFMRSLAVFDDSHAARRFQTDQIKHFGLTLLMARNNAAGVVCLDTGERWPSAYQCAKGQKIDLSALIKHLNGQAGFITVKGKKYRRISVDNKN